MYTQMYAHTLTHTTHAVYLRADAYTVILILCLFLSVRSWNNHNFVCVWGGGGVIKEEGNNNWSKMKQLEQLLFVWETDHQPAANSYYWLAVCAPFQANTTDPEKSMLWKQRLKKKSMKRMKNGALQKKNNKFKKKCEQLSFFVFSRIPHAFSFETLCLSWQEFCHSRVVFIYI